MPTVLKYKQKLREQFRKGGVKVQIDIQRKRQTHAEMKWMEGRDLSHLHDVAVVGVPPTFLTKFS